MPRQNLSSFQSIMNLTGFHFQLCVDGICMSHCLKIQYFCIDHACKSKINVTKDLSSWKETLLFVSSARGICTYCTPWRPITWVFNQIQCRRPLYRPYSMKGTTKDKGRRCYLGDIFGCRTHHLAIRMIWRKVFGRISFLGGWCMVWCGVNQMIIHFSKASILSGSHSSFSCNDLLPSVWFLS